MSEEKAFEEQENFTQDESEGLQKQVSIGLKPHPITSEMGVVLSIGEEDTWMQFSVAKRLIGDIDITINTGICLGTVMNLMRKMPEPPNTIFTK
jgi:hypothetical protein